MFLLILPQYFAWQGPFCVSLNTALLGRLSVVTGRVTGLTKPYPSISVNFIGYKRNNITLTITYRIVFDMHTRVFAESEKPMALKLSKSISSIRKYDVFTLKLTWDRPESLTAFRVSEKILRETIEVYVIFFVIFNFYRQPKITKFA